MPSLTKIVNHPLFNIAFFFGIRQVTKRLPLDEPEYLWGLRLLYLGSQAICIGLNLWLMWQVTKKNGKKKETLSLLYRPMILTHSLPDNRSDPFALCRAFEAELGRHTDS